MESNPHNKNNSNLNASNDSLTKLDGNGNQVDKNEKTSQEKEMIQRSDDAGYTPEENQFADGKGTTLDKEIEKDSTKDGD